MRTVFPGGIFSREHPRGEIYTGMKNVKTFREFKEDESLQEYNGYSPYRGPSSYEPPDPQGGFQELLGKGKIFGSEGAIRSLLKRDREGGRIDVVGGIKKTKDRAASRWKRKKGFLDHLKGGEEEGVERERIEPPTRSRRSEDPSREKSPEEEKDLPQKTRGSSGASDGMGIPTSDGRWKGIVNSLRGISPSPKVDERSAEFKFPGGKISEISWEEKSGTRGESSFPLSVRVANNTVAGDYGKVEIVSVKHSRSGEDPKDISIAAKIDEFWRRKGYGVSGPTMDASGRVRPQPVGGGIVLVTYSLKNPEALRSDLQEMLTKFTK